MNAVWPVDASRAYEHRSHLLVYWLSLGACVAPVFSIAVSSILFVAALLGVLMIHRWLYVPRLLLWPLLAFVLLTFVSWAFSPDPRAGWPQIKQLSVWLTLPLILTAFRAVPRFTPLIYGWAIAASASAIWSFYELWQRRQFALERGYDFYSFYVGDRASGFLSHWMAFGGVQMVVLLVLVAVLLSNAARRWLWIAVMLIGASIVVSFTRSVWLGAAVGVLFLVASTRPKLLWAVPILAIAGWFAAPASVRERAVSVYQPHGTVDSNEHRSVTRRTGMEMIKAKPLTGVGLEMPGRLFNKYIPADISRPLPEGFYGHLHNLYLQYAAERGMPALLAFLWLLVAIVLSLQTSARRQTDPVARSLALGGIAVVLGVATEAFFEVNLGDSEVLRLFWSCIATALAANETASDTFNRGS